MASIVKIQQTLVTKTEGIINIENGLLMLRSGLSIVHFLSTIISITIIIAIEIGILKMSVILWRNRKRKIDTI